MLRSIKMQIQYFRIKFKTLFRNGVSCREFDENVLFILQTYVGVIFIICYVHAYGTANKYTFIPNTTSIQTIVILRPFFNGYFFFKQQLYFINKTSKRQTAYQIANNFVVFVRLDCDAPRVAYKSDEYLFLR